MTTSIHDQWEVDGDDENFSIRRPDPQDDESSDFCSIHKIDYFPSDCHGWCPKCWREYRLREAKVLRDTLHDIGSHKLS